MRVGIDFDRVLFRTDDFIEFLENQIPGFSQEYPQDKVYDPSKHAERLGIDEERILKTLRRSEEFLYDDIDRLDELRPQHELILVSRGQPSFQGKKITNSGVCRLFDAIVVIENGPKDRINIDFLVDDAIMEHEKTDIPGLRFDRGNHGIDDIIEKVKELEAQRSV